MHVILALSHKYQITIKNMEKGLIKTFMRKKNLKLSDFEIMKK